MMEAAEDVLPETASSPKSDANPGERERKPEDPENLRVLSVDKVTVEKFVLESSNGSREVLLRKNETSRKLSVKSSEPVGRRLLRRPKDERQDPSNNPSFRLSVPEEILISRSNGALKENLPNGAQSKLPLWKNRRSNSSDNRIKPIRLTKSPSIGSILIGSRSASLSAKSKVPPEKAPLDSDLASGSPSSPAKDSREEIPTAAAQLVTNQDTKAPEPVGQRSGHENEVQVDQASERNKEEELKVPDPLGPRCGKVESGDEPEVQDARTSKLIQDRLEKSQTTIEDLQKNLTTKINASTAQSYKEKLLGLRGSRTLKLTPSIDGNGRLLPELAFDKEFLQKHSLDKQLKIEEKRFLETDLDYASDCERVDDRLGEAAVIETKETWPSYSRKVSEVEKRWSGEFLEGRFHRGSSESSKSSYVEELGSASSRESVAEPGSGVIFVGKKREDLGVSGTSLDVIGRRTSQEILEASTVNTVDSDSCLEERIKAVDEDICEGNDGTSGDEDVAVIESDRQEDLDKLKEVSSEAETITVAEVPYTDNKDPVGSDKTNLEAAEPCPLDNKLPELKSDTTNSSCRPSAKLPDDTTYIVSNRSRRDGYANLIKEFTMEAGSSRVKKEEKQKKKLGLRRLLPGFFSPKDSRKDYKKKEQKERSKKHEDRNFARYQQNGNYTRSPDTMNLNEDIKRNVKLDNSLNGSIIEERLDEIKRELFPDQGLTTSTPDHFLEQDDRGLMHDHGRGARSYTVDSSLSSIAPDDRWNERSLQLGISPDIRKYEQRQKLEELGGRRYGQLERKHSLQEHNPCGRTFFFQRNHGPSGRISAPPGERYLVRPRAIHPIDRPLPAIPHSRIELANYENYLEEQEACDDVDSYRDQSYVLEKSGYADSRQPILYENSTAGKVDESCLMIKSVAAHVKITRQPIVNQNQRAPLVGRSPKYASSGSSQKSGDYADSSCTPNSSQKSELSPCSSKSGEYYLNSPRSGASPNDQSFDEPRREGIYENQSPRSPIRRVYNQTPSSPSREMYHSTPKPAGASPSKRDGLVLNQSISPARSIASKSSTRQGSGDEQNKSIERQERKQRDSSAEGDRTTSQSMSPTKSQGRTLSTSSSSSTGRSSSRKSQPNDQILIASPKREAMYDRAPRPSDEVRNRGLESPVPMTNIPQRAPVQAPVEQRSHVSPRNPASPGPLPTQLPRPEPIYGHRKQPVPSRRTAMSPTTVKSEAQQGEDDRVAWVQGQTSTPTKSIEKRFEPKSANDQVPSPLKSCRSPVPPLTNIQVQVIQQGAQLTQARRAKSPEVKPGTQVLMIDREKIVVSPGLPSQDQRLRQQQRPRRLEEPLYGQRVSEPVYGPQYIPPGGPLSPSKKETRQHLEAFYWQQKALEAHRKTASPMTPNPKQPVPKIDLPEVREAVYWQQLKKLDEEQQRRIYERNMMEDGSHGDARPKDPRMYPPPSNIPRLPVARNPIMPDPTVSGAYVGTYYWDSKLQRPKLNPTGKPPLMQSQKVSNQPVLIVRPQQAIRNPVKHLDLARQEAQRSKSASPHFPSRLEAPPGYAVSTKPTPEAGNPLALIRKQETPSIYEEEAAEVDGKPTPAPIFKRGSLIGAEVIEYGTTGPKRVSFSSQARTGQDLVTGKWPTKHGTAPEPPTRRHRSEDSTSDTDSVFSNPERRDADQDGLYGNPGPYPVMRGRNEVPGGIEAEYDANRPLPPVPNEPGTRSVVPGIRNSPFDGAWNVDGSVRPPSGPQQGAVGDPVDQQGIQRQKQEEEWNPDGKGRQSNDTGGPGRGEVDPGANELVASRRGGGGCAVGGVAGGGVLGGGGGSGGRGTSGGRSRDEPRRHTLGGDHQPSLHHQQFNASQPLHPHHPHHLPPPHGQYGTPARHTTMDLEMGTKSRQRKSPLPRGYPPPSSTMLFDDDPGIMSEVETSSTGFRRGGKQRSSLPVVRTPSKTLERPLGLVFLQYRNETKRALLPNEITSIDTVKALFVRSFPKQLTMEYLDSPHVKVYIHDSNKNMFYELEDLRSHLRDIRDRSVLRLFESSDGVTGMPGPIGGVPGGLPPHWEDQSYFSEPEFDSEYQHQHIHKSKTAKNSTSNSGYYVGGSSTLPRGGPLLRAYSPAASSVVGGPPATPNQPKTLTTPGGGGVPPAKPLRSYQCGKSPLGSLGGSARFSRDSSVSLYSIPDRLHGESGYMSSPERGGGVGSGTGRYPPGPYSAGSSYEDPYYSQYSGTVTPVIDEEASDTELLEESYSLYGVKPPGRPPSGPPRSPFPPGAPPLPPPLPPGQTYDATRIRVEHMERQLANLTGLVQKALTHAPHPSPSPRDYLQVPAGRDPYSRAADDSYLRTDVKPPKLGKDKSVSFEKSVSFSDEPPDMNSPKQHSPQHAADTKPTKPAIKSSTLPRMSSQERDRHKPTPPPKPAALVAGQYVYRDLALTPEMYNQLRGLQKKAKDLRQEVRNLRRMSQAQAHTVRETIRDTFITIRAMLLSGGDAWAAGDAEKVRLSREEDLYKQEMLRLEKDLTELESTVEELRGNVINRKTRVNMSDVENMALILSKSSKTVADLKVRFPGLQEGMKGLLSSEMEKVVREEKFLKEEPERLESALRRCKKLTGTLVTLKRLASVQEQRLPNAASVESEETPPITPTSSQHSKPAAPVPAERTVVGSASVISGGPLAHESSAAHQQRPENALDALLDELQTFSRPSSQLGQVQGAIIHQSSLTEIGRSGSRDLPATGTVTPAGRAPCISEIGRKGSVDSSTGGLVVGLPGAPGAGTLRRLHSYPSSSDTDTSPPIARLQVSLQEQPNLPVLPQGFVPGQKPPVPERNAELLQLATARRVPPPPPPRTSSRSPLASPTSPQLPPRNHACQLQPGNATLRRPAVRNLVGKEGKPPMALPPDATAIPPGEPGAVTNNSTGPPPPTVLSTSNSSSCESVNSQEGMQSKRDRQEQLEQRHQELLRKQKALQEQYARLQQLQRNAAGLTTVPPAPPDLLKKTGSESNLLAKMGLGMSAASSGSLTSLSLKPPATENNHENLAPGQEEMNGQGNIKAMAGNATVNTVCATACESNGIPMETSATTAGPTGTSGTLATNTTTSKIYETDIL